MAQPTTEEWATSFGISTAPTPPAVEDYDEPCEYTARQIGIRAIILQGVSAVASGVDSEMVVEWFQEELVWDFLSPKERAFLSNPKVFDRQANYHFQWQVEAEWALLWVIGKLESLGLPTHKCDTKRLVDEIIPGLFSEIEPFLSSARVQSLGILLAEDLRHYELWCRYFQTQHKGDHLLPSDLNISVLYQREYAFQWLRLHGLCDWDEVTCDA